MSNSPEKKIAVITGASAGIGKATALALAQEGMALVLVCRSRERGENAIAEIKALVPEAQISLHLADLSVLAEVRVVAQEIIEQYPVIDVLINNAGMIPGLQELTIEGLELAWATNHLAPFLLTNLLMSPLMAAKQGRIINVSSDAHRLGQIEFDSPGMAKHYSAITSYADSKLANILFTYELARRTEFTDVTVNCLHPGIVATNFGSTSNLLIRTAMKMARFFMKSAKEGAKPTIFLATSPSVVKVSGKYFKKFKPAKSSDSSYNHHTARRLWEVSQEQTDFY